MSSEKEKNYVTLNMKLSKEGDADIIKFLEDKPNAYIIRLALRRFMNDSRDVLAETPTTRSAATNESSSDLLDF